MDLGRFIVVFFLLDALGLEDSHIQTSDFYCEVIKADSHASTHEQDTRQGPNFESSTHEPFALIFNTPKPVVHRMVSIIHALLYGIFMNISK